MKQRSKRRMSRILILTSLVLLLTGLSSPVSAAIKTTALTNANSANSIPVPVSEMANTGNTAVLQNGDTVYYGVYPQGKITNIAGLTENVDYVVIPGENYAIQPIPWRVLDNGSGGLFLLSEDNLAAMPYHDVDPAQSITWEQSTVRSWLNGYPSSENAAGVNHDYADTGLFNSAAGFNINAFTAAERTAIKTTALTNANNANGTPGGNSTNDKIFLLSLEDTQGVSRYFPTGQAGLKAYNTDYVGGHPDMYAPGDSDFWWLRSPGTSADQARAITESGDNALGIYVDDSAMAIRPAFNLDLSSVLFSSDASGTMKSDATVGGVLVGVVNPTGAVKMTVLNDTGLGLTVTDTRVRTAAPGATVSIAYTGAKTGANRSVSVMLCDSTGAPLYYGRPADCTTNASGIASFTVPSTLPAGSYTIKIFNEEVNGAYYTDFASTPQSIALTVGASYKSGDINQDGDVNIVDLNILLTNFGQMSPAISNPRADINKDGDVNIVDLNILLTNFGT